MFLRHLVCLGSSCIIHGHSYNIPTCSAHDKQSDAVYRLITFQVKIRGSLVCLTPVPYGTLGRSRGTRSIAKSCTRSSLHIEIATGLPYFLIIEKCCRIVMIHVDLQRYKRLIYIHVNADIVSTESFYSCEYHFSSAPERFAIRDLRLNHRRSDCYLLQNVIDKRDERNDYSILNSVLIMVYSLTVF